MLAPEPSDQNENTPENETRDISIQMGQHSSIKKRKPLMNQKTLFVLNISLNCVLFAVEIIIGYLLSSLALVSDALHVFTDVFSTVVGLVALIYADKDRRSSHIRNYRYTYGFERFQIMGSLANGFLLLAFSINIIIESFIKFIIPDPVRKPMYVLIVGVVGLFFNILSACLFHDQIRVHRHDHKIVEIEDQIDQSITSEPQIRKPKAKSSTYLNLYGVFLHIFGDLIGSLLVIVVSVSKIFSDHPFVDYLDPLLSILLSSIMIFACYRQLRFAIPIFLQKTPSHLDALLLKRKIKNKFPQLKSVHELHLWQLTPETYIATLHIKVSDFNGLQILVKSIQDFLRSFGIFSVTIQPEIADQTFDDDELEQIEEFCSFQLEKENEIKSTCCPHLHQRTSGPEE
ncbi:Zinc homeostasis factor 1 [Thelohanellus kitauei]|uniref:Zinc homeostasis factor 1 n=1 Tax=Thelohanellus kitauei TaxID=669202 RepID=A0A0C2N199_THEKT|nr:Zinc homeostasis factor 1 [Thelohanellus kitauei]